MGRRRARLALATIAMLALAAPPASAHAAYEYSTPNDGETVSAPPSEVEANFTEPVTSDSFLKITDPCGAVVSGSSRPVADTITTSMNGSHAGTYTVYFRVQSTVDSHVTDGTFTFTSSGGDPCPGSEPQGGGDGGGNGGGSDGDGGGTSNDGSSDGSSSDAGTSSQSDSRSGSDQAGSDPSAERADGPAGGGGKKEGRERGRSRNADTVPLTIERERERREPDPWDLPRDGLIAALVVASLIGAAGGRIYAAILGPRT